jgi:uncharacterized protein YciW
MFREAAKEGTFLDAYMQHLDPLETPRAYDFWTGMWMLSNAVGRRLVINRPRAPVFLNTYIILVAEAGTTRKSTAVRIATSILQDAGMLEHAHLVTSSSNKAAMDEGLSKLTADGNDAQLCISVSELVSFMGKEVHAISTPGYLTDIYDCPSERVVERAVGAKRISNLYPTLLSASTPSWLVRAINPDVIEGGFTSRCLFIWEEQPKRRVAWPQENALAGMLRGQMFSELKRVRELANKHNARGIGITKNALARFVQWYEDRELVVNNSFLASFQAREDHHVLRAAGLLACNDCSFMIDHHHIGHAIKLITSARDKASHIFAPPEADHTRLATGIERVRAVIHEAGELGVQRTRILYATRRYVSVRELNYVLQLMHDLGMIRVFEESTRGRKATIYRRTDKLNSRAAFEALLDGVKQE